MKLIYGLFILFFTTQIYASMVKINGVIEKNTLRLFINLNAYIDGDKSFPQTYYKSDYIFISKLAYDQTVPYNDRKIDLKIFNTIGSRGKLELISYNKTNGAYQFKLSLVTNVFYGSQNIFYKIYSFEVNSPVYFQPSKLRTTIIEGKVTHFNGVKNLVSLFNKNNYATSLTLDDEGIIFKALQDIPVSFEVDTNKIEIPPID